LQLACYSVPQFLRLQDLASLAPSADERAKLEGVSYLQAQDATALPVRLDLLRVVPDALLYAPRGRARVPNNVVSQRRAPARKPVEAGMLKSSVSAKVQVAVDG